MGKERADLLQRARRIAEEWKPEASAYLHSAFANSVVILVTGESGGDGGPSVREHAVSRLFEGGPCSFDEAVELLLDEEGPIFGPLTELHHQIRLSEYCFDDDPADIVELQGYSEWP